MGDGRGHLILRAQPGVMRALNDLDSYGRAFNTSGYPLQNMANRIDRLSAELNKCPTIDNSGVISYRKWKHSDHDRRDHDRRPMGLIHAAAGAWRAVQYATRPCRVGVEVSAVRASGDSDFAITTYLRLPGSWLIRSDRSCVHGTHKRKPSHQCDK